MEIRTLEAMLQVVNENAEAERKAREKKETMELRQAALRKEKEIHVRPLGVRVFV